MGPISHRFSFKALIKKVQNEHTVITELFVFGPPPLTETENRDVEGSSISELEEWRVINCSRLLVGVYTTFLDTTEKLFFVSP